MRTVIFKETLEDLYTDQGLTPSQIADHLGVSFSIVSKALRRYNFPLLRKTSVVRNKPIDSAWLQDQFVTHKRSLKSIGDEVGCTAHAIRRRLLEDGVPMRTQGGQIPITDRDWLMEELWHKNRTLTEIAAERSCGLAYLRREMRRLQIPQKPKALRMANSIATGYGTAQRRRRRNGNFTDTQRLRIMQRDGTICRLCHSGEVLTVHHIIPDRFGGPAVIDNGITLCEDCHWKLYRHELDYVDALLAARGLSQTD